jgi:hypothetical protein
MARGTRPSNVMPHVLPPFLKARDSNFGQAEAISPTVAFVMWMGEVILRVTIFLSLRRGFNVMAVIGLL